MDEGSHTQPAEQGAQRKGEMMARYTPQRLIEILADRLDPENLTRREMRSIAGRLLVLSDYLCDELGLDETEADELRSVTVAELEAEVRDDGVYDEADDEEDEDDDEDEEDDENV